MQAEGVHRRHAPPVRLGLHRVAAQAHDKLASPLADGDPIEVKAWGQVFAATRQARKLASGLDDLPPKHRARLRQELQATVAGSCRRPWRRC